MTRCEGPSMMPTIQPSGEIILIEKMSHRWYGLEGGGDHGENRATMAQEKQNEWEVEESRLWLGGKFRRGVVADDDDDGGENSGGRLSRRTNTKSKRKRLSKKEKEELMSVHTWYAPKLKEVNTKNYRYLSSWTKCYEKITTGIAIGDVVVLQHPDREGTVCKRVLALPGDTVIRPKQQYERDVYATRFRERRRRNQNHRDVMNTFHQNHDDDNGAHNPTSFEGALLKNSTLFVVPDGHLWVEGDNSLNSSDSRNYGPVSAALVVGKVWMKLWPIGRGNTLMVRGSPPMPQNRNIPFKGSTSLPAGYNGQTIVLQK